MKILNLIYDHVENPWVGGGGAVRSREIMTRLASHGNQVTCISGRFPGAEDRAAFGIRHLFMGVSSNYMASTFSYAFEAARYLLHRSGDYDVVIEDFAPWNPVMSRFISKTPAMIQLHHREGASINRRYPVLGMPFYLVEKYYPGLFKNVCAVSEATAIKYGLPGAEIIPNGIDSSLLEIERQEEEFILYLGRLEISNKGLDTLIEAVRRMDGTKLVLAGRGRDEGRLKEMAKGLPVEFKGFVDEEEKKLLLSRCKAFVLPSRFEGWGIVVMEAAAAGAPVVVSSIPELSYAVKGAFAVPFGTGEPAQLKTALDTVLGDTELRAALSLKGREAASGYTWDKIALKFEDYLKRIASA